MVTETINDTKVRRAEQLLSSTSSNLTHLLTNILPNVHNCMFKVHSSSAVVVEKGTLICEALCIHVERKQM